MASTKPGQRKLQILQALAAKHPLRDLRPGDDWTTGRGIDGSLIKP